MVLTGLLIVTYPFASQRLNETNNSRAIDTYQEKLHGLSKQQIKEMKEAARVYNESLTGQPVHDPFIPGSGIVMPDNYYEVLNVNDVMGQIEIPKIDVNLPIFHGTSEKVLEKAVGHLEGSTLPIGGTTIHAIITGHTGLMNAKLFTDLVELQEGDQFYLTILDETLAYEINQIEVVEPEHITSLRTESGKNFVTLLTCTPYGVNSHRLLVRGERIPYDSGKKEPGSRQGLTKEQIQIIVAISITTMIMFSVILIVVILKRRVGNSK